MKYGIQILGFMQNKESDWEYFTGDKYSINHEMYAACDGDKLKAKPYSSKKRAKNTCDSMYRKYANVADTRVVPLE